MRALIKKIFKYDGVLFRKGQVLEIPFPVYLILSRRGLIKPLLPEGGLKLNRPCVVCGSDSWHKLKKRNSLIICLVCNHGELFIKGDNNER